MGKMKKDYIIKFDRISIHNRWKQKKYARQCNWTVFGFQVWWAGFQNYCYKICFFGFDIQIWFFRQFI